MKNLFNKYILMGLFTIGIDYIMIYIIYSIFEMNYILAIMMGFLVSSIFQFYANFFYTFSLEKKDDYYWRIILFCISASLAIIIGTTTVVFFNSFVQSLYISKTLSLFISFLYGYSASKYVIFNKKFSLKNVKNFYHIINSLLKNKINKKGKQ